MHLNDGYNVLMQENQKRRIVRLKKQSNQFKNMNICSFIEHLEIIKKEMLFLFQGSHLAKDAKFLRKMAINIKQLHFDAKKTSKSSEHRQQAIEVEHFLSTPIGAPFVSAITLLQAADSFSEQHPKESDLSHLLEDYAKYGKHYASQLLRALLLSQRKRSKTA
jgi:hypothetical protein